MDISFPKRFSFLLLSFLASFLTASSADAFYMNFLRYSPIYYFTKEDSDKANATVYQALKSAKDGEKRSWQNPKTGAFGYALPSNTQGSCRELEIFNSAKQVTSKTQYRFCKINGEWKIVE